MSGEYNPFDYIGLDEDERMACGHAHPCARRCEECRKRSCPDCVHIWDNINTCAKCAPAVVEFLIKQAGELARLDLTNEVVQQDLRQTMFHAIGLGQWAARLQVVERAARAVRLVTRPTMEDALAEMGAK